ncbi:agamous-like MADS-box protein AGL62 [Salvia divinorum]|uniref:Agamous-like MADS-box protein AGL62 n=1 Tax=Salvia divinorum TaxID=28513 RepID=A0ABD1HMF2_SALDI
MQHLAMEVPKKTLGRRKIPIKKIEKKSSLQVTFTKRRGGLFSKAGELAVLCGAEVAILVKSPAEKLYSFGQPEALINRVAPSPAQIRREHEGRIKYEEAEKRLEMEKKEEVGSGLWWEEPCEDLQLQELEQLLESLDDFGGKVEENLNYAPPLSLQQLMAADDFVIATDTSFFYDQD